MSQVHALNHKGSSLRCVVHAAPPAGSNTANHTWQSVFLAAGKSGTTILTEGTLPGQIATAEKSQITSGALVEFVIDLIAPRGATLAELNALATEVAPGIVAETFDRWRSELRFWGAEKV